MMKGLETLAIELMKASRDPSRNVERPEPPPPAPESWDWSHVRVEGEGGVLSASIAEPYHRGCLDCHRYWKDGTGYVDCVIDGPFGETKAVQQCPKCSKLKEMAKTVNRSRMPSKFLDRDFDWSVVLVDGEKDPRGPLFDWVSGCCDWIASGGSGEGRPSSIALLGPTGRGKSHAAFMLLRRAIARGLFVRWCHWSELLDSVMSKKKTQSEAFESVLIEPGLVVVDDFGVGVHSGWARDIACAFLESVPSRTFCIYTTNGVPDDPGANGLDSMIGARAASRLSGVCGRGALFFEFQGQDWRKGQS